MASEEKTQKSFFDALGFKETIKKHYDYISSLYAEDNMPWVIGFSGGKDSTAVLQLIWGALQTLDKDKLNKPVYVISTDTGVENPKIVSWVEDVFIHISEAAQNCNLPISTHRLRPKTEDSFWVSLIGKGYPAPRPNFRWCTSRLKISPSHSFINNIVNNYGECILALGTRKSESQSRARNMERHEQLRTKEYLSPNGDLKNCQIFTPIEAWSNDDVWLFLTRSPNPWGVDNLKLLELYKEATQDRECPLVVDENTPSCGSSRFGCWVCTMVSKDVSMQAMIANDVSNEWLIPLSKFRDLLEISDDSRHRDIRRLNGQVQLLKDTDRNIPGPYTQERREFLLQELLKTELEIRRIGPEQFRGIALITKDELSEIRRIWIEEKHEIEDSLPEIYRQVFDEEFPERFSYALPFKREDILALKDTCSSNEFSYQLCRELISIEWGYRTMARRAGIYNALENAFKKSYYKDPSDAIGFARLRKRIKIEADQNHQNSADGE